MSNLDALEAATDAVTAKNRRHSPNCKRQQHKVATRERVLKAATRLFRHVGYEKTTIRAIAARICMSTGAIFANFADKDALYRAAFGHAPLSPEDGLILRDRLIELTKAAIAGDVPNLVLAGACDDLDRICPDWRASLRDPEEAAADLETADEEAAPW